MSWKAVESVFRTSSGLLLSEVTFCIEALAKPIFRACGCTPSQTDLAQASSSLLLLHPDSVSTSTTPPDSAAANFLFTDGPLLLTSGPGTYTPHDGRAHAVCPDIDALSGIDPMGEMAHGPGPTG